MPKSERQKLKIFYTADFLMRKTDADSESNMHHGVLLKDIREYLDDKGIEAEEHGIRRDIDLLGELLDIQGGKGKPVYVASRLIPFDDVETIAECIASANFINKNEAEELIDELKFLCSEYQANRLKSDYIVAERPKYTRKRMLGDISTIKEAISKEKAITFYYTTHSTTKIDQINRRNKGKQYSVSPFKIVLSEGRHYLIGYNNVYHHIRPYRIDRMEEVDISDTPREGEDKFKRMGISDYAKQTFGMFIGGNADRITLLFENSLLDAMIERFGPDRRLYAKVDDKHFTVKTFIVESENFYGWLCGLGEKAIITDPPDVAGRFKDYLQKISANYQ